MWPIDHWIGIGGLKSEFRRSGLHFICFKLFCFLSSQSHRWLSGTTRQSQFGTYLLFPPTTDTDERMDVTSYRLLIRFGMDTRCITLWKWYYNVMLLDVDMIIWYDQIPLVTLHQYHPPSTWSWKWSRSEEGVSRSQKSEHCNRIMTMTI